MFYSINGSYFNSIKIIEHLSEDIKLENLSIEELKSKLVESNNELENLDLDLNRLGTKESILGSIKNYKNFKIKDTIDNFINNNLYDDVDNIIKELNNLVETKNMEVENLNNKIKDLQYYKSKVNDMQLFYLDSVNFGKNKVIDLENKIEQLSTVKSVNVTSLRNKDKSDIKYYPGPYVYDKCDSNYDKSPFLTAKIMKDDDGKFVLAHGVDEEGKLGLLINNNGDLVLEQSPYIDINGFKLEFSDNELRIVTSSGKYGISIDFEGSINLFAGNGGNKNYFCIDDQTDRDNCLDKNKIKMIQTINNLVK